MKQNDEIQRSERGGLPSLTWRAGTRYVAATLTLLAGMSTITLTTSVLADTRRAVESETRQHGAPMVWVQGGDFTMGSQNGLLQEAPEHRVYLDGFYIDRWEVTTARYAKFLKAIGANQEDQKVNGNQIRFMPRLWEQVQLPMDGDRPVIGVTWEAADFYCRWVGKRLPSEAEWEKAARGSDGRTYPWGNNQPTFELANYQKPVFGNLYSDGLRPVDGYEAGKSPYGVHHMAGNAAEWVADWYDETYYTRTPQKNPHGPEHGSQKVFRGGSFADPDSHLQSAARVTYVSNETGPYVGIRCARSF